MAQCNKHNSRMRWRCPRLTSERFKQCPECREIDVRSKKRLLANPAYAFARKLREDCGFDLDQAKMVGKELAKPDQRCFYCLVPQSLLYRLKAENFSLPGGNRWNRLTIEHRNPTIRNKHIVLSCWFCNDFRKDGIRTDVEVREYSLARWEEIVGERVVAHWLNKAGYFEPV